MNKTHFYTLCISDDFNSNVAFFRDTELLYAVAEERLTRVKGQAGYPQQSISWVLKEEGIDSLDKVDEILFANKWHFVYRLLGKWFRGYEHDFFSWQQKAYLYFHHIMNNVYFLGDLCEDINKYLVSRKTHRIASLLDHHTAHAYSAYFSSGYANALAVTVDNMGDGYATCVFKCIDGRIKRLY